MPTALKIAALLAIERAQRAEAATLDAAPPTRSEFAVEPLNTRNKEEGASTSSAHGLPVLERASATLTERARRQKDLPTQIAWGTLDAQKEARERGEAGWTALVTLAERKRTLEMRWREGQAARIARASLQTLQPQ